MRRLYMAYIIGIILVIITLIIVGLIMRKRVYDEVDRQESWKMDIMDRNIASELSRIKKLNLSGETQEKFESWKQRWEYIVERELTDVEEHLFDAEEAADRYRFPSAKKAIRKTEEDLQSIENDIKEILIELDELIDSEENSRQKVEEIHPNLKALKKILMQNSYQYGKAITQFEKELELLEFQLDTYEELTKSGNYIEASQLVESLYQELEQLEGNINEFPALLTACKTDLPNQLNELLRGIKEMKDDGYRVEHLGFEKEINIYIDRLSDCIEALDQNDVKEPKSTVEDIDERIKEMYLLLEKEAVAKNYLETHYTTYENDLSDIASEFNNTKLEVEQLKQSYYFDDRDLEKFVSIDKAINRIINEKEEIDDLINDSDTSHTELRGKLEDSFHKIKELEINLIEFRDMIQSLRKDEIEAREELSSIREQINTVNKRIQKSNIPGVPRFIWNYIEETKDKNNNVLIIIEQQPLDMNKVQHALKEAKSAVDHLVEQTDIMLDQAYLTEQVIQYANRYRSQIQSLEAELSEAEKLFRKFEYELALERAAKAIEEVEPGALKKIEEYQSASI